MAENEGEIRCTQKWDESDDQDSEDEEEVISKPKRPLPVILRSIKDFA